MGPVNVGSGQGIRIVELAHRIVALAGNQSPIRYCAPRGIEVIRFVADTKRMRTLLGVDPAGDPLGCLPSLLDSPSSKLESGLHA